MLSKWSTSMMEDETMMKLKVKELEAKNTKLKLWKVPTSEALNGNMCSDALHLQLVHDNHI